MTTSTAELTLTERDFQQQIVELARIYGWEDFHVRAGRTRDSWRVPGSGSMAAGWPDLVLLHPDRRLLLFVEVKRSGGKTTPAQDRVLGLLGMLDDIAAETYVWRPEDWPFIERKLAS